MPKRSRGVPAYRKHKASGQAVVTLGGRDHYLGLHGTRTGLAEYDRVVAEWLGNGWRARRILVARNHCGRSGGPLMGLRRELQRKVAG